MIEGIEQAKGRWPELSVDLTRFGEHLAERNIDVRNVSPAIVVDLYLAFACQNGLSGAEHAFRVAFWPVVATACRPFNPSEAFSEDILQRVLETLLVAPPGRQARISQYAGRGSLAGWVRIAARRMALRESKKGEVLSEDDSFVADLVADPEFEAMLATYVHRDELADIVGRAVRESPDRRLIQLVFELGFSTVKAAKALNLSQPTVSRRIKKALDSIVDVVREEVKQRFQLNDQSVDSFLALFRSQFQLHELLASDEDKDAK
jgi:RNA polymerase sigma-70 factor (ECF subfamily)